MYKVKHGDCLSLHLIQPTNKLREPFLAMLQAYRQDNSACYCDEYKDKNLDFDRYINQLEQHRKGLDLPLGYVSYSTYWLTDETEHELYGTSRLRHRLCDFLLFEGGHIGYDIHPQYRRKGYGSLLCGLTLAEAKKRGIDNVLLICNGDNIGSKNIIENNGGVLQDTMVSPFTGKSILRYWIAT